MARILIIEDEPNIALILTEVLADEGYEVDSAPGGAEGLRRLGSEAPPGLVILDLLMPGVGGRQVLSEMRSTPALAGIPVILITGVVPTSRDFPPGEQFQALLTKPFKLDDVLRTVERCLAR